MMDDGRDPREEPVMGHGIGDEDVGAGLRGQPPQPLSRTARTPLRRIDSLWNHAARVNEPDDWTEFRRSHLWSFSADAFDFSAEEDDGEYRHVAASADFGFTLTIAFPATDIERIVDRVRGTLVAS